MFVGNHIAVGEGSEMPSRYPMHPRKDERVYVDLVSGDGASRTAARLALVLVLVWLGTGKVRGANGGAHFRQRRLRSRIFLLLLRKRQCAPNVTAQLMRVDPLSSAVPKPHPPLAPTSQRHFSHPGKDSLADEL